MSAYTQYTIVDAQKNVQVQPVLAEEEEEEEE